ncbi:carboxylate--amine ligase [Lysinibacillus sp. 54212]|uniref:carboxylate--amine ligase n=1 Tax=Lysinibacillus sp. 54212 TaxID=3119829 RepID=UPI002FC9F281
MEKEQAFLPVLLGSGMNAYGMARAFFEAYGLKPLVLGNSQLPATQDSRILTFYRIDKLNSQEVFLPELEKVAAQIPNRKLLLLACGDDYAQLIIRNKEKLEKHFTVPYISKALMEELLSVEGFQRHWDKYNFSYPTSTTVSIHNFEHFTPPFDYPIIMKPANLLTFWDYAFPARKKVFIAQDHAEQTAILKAIYSSTYQDEMIVQQYIPGDDTNLRVLDAYVDKNGKAKLLALGNPMLQEHLPEGIGSYGAIITTYDQELMDGVRYFLEGIGYTGLASFTFKYDSRDGQYKLLKMSIRNSRSSYFVTASGHNLMQYIADDHMLHIHHSLTYVQDKHLWMILPKNILFKYASNEKLKIEAKSLIRQGKFTNSLFYEQDMNPKRWTKLTLNRLGYYRSYKKHINNKDLSE